MMQKITPLTNSKKKLLFIALLLLICEYSFAGTLDTSFAGAITSQSTSWMNKLMPIGMSIGTGLWFIESIWQIKKQGLYDNGEKLLMFCLQRTLIFSVASSIFFNIDVYKHITEVFLTPAKSIAGLSSSGLDSGSIWQSYYKWRVVWGKVYSHLSITDVGAKIEMLFYMAIYMICCIYISFEMIKLKIMFLIILYSGCIFAGCYTSDWAKKYWVTYVSLLIGISFQTLVFCLIYSSIQTMFDYDHLQNLFGDFAVSYNLQIVSIFIGCLCLKTIPEKLGGVIGGAGAGSISANLMQLASKAVSAASSGASKVIDNIGNKSVPGGGLKNSGGSGGSQPAMNNSNKSNFMNKK